ncbi:Ada metal-binding domain-containing protein [Bacillus pacificus]
MYNEGVTLTNEHWQAIIHNDSSYDSKFFYAVKSTGIFAGHHANQEYRIKTMYEFFIMQSKR